MCVYICVCELISLMQCSSFNANPIGYHRVDTRGLVISDVRSLMFNFPGELKYGCVAKRINWPLSIVSNIYLWSTINEFLTRKTVG